MTLAGEVWYTISMDSNYHKDYYQRNKDKIAAQQKAYRKTTDKWRGSNREAVLDRYYAKYGLDYAKYLAMSEAQEHKCAICNQEEINTDPRTNRVRRLAVDHCHATGKIRGLLCFACNRALGGFKDSQDLLASAINYLKGEHIARSH